VRGTTIKVDPNDALTALSRVPLLVRSKGAEIGMQVAIADTLQAWAAFFSRSCSTTTENCPPDIEPAARLTPPPHG